MNIVERSPTGGLEATSSRVWRHGALRAAVVFAVLVLMHWPFLFADADGGLGRSRGPFTDEGLYSAQARNAMVTGHLDLAESDAALKNPLFAAVAFGVLSTFGDTMATLRAAIVLSGAAFLALLASGRSPFARTVLWAIPFAFLSYFPFQYAHLALAEIPSCLALIGALWLLHLRLRGHGAWTLLASGFLIFVSYTLKVQFLYAATVPPLALLLSLGMRKRAGIPITRRDMTDFGLACLVALALALVYAAVWVLPNRALFTAVTDQVSERSSSLIQIPGTAFRQTRSIFRDPAVWPIVVVFVAGVAAAWRRWRLPLLDSDARQAWIALMAPPAAWLLIETHKLTLSYLPSRYYVSLLLALALVGVAGLRVAPWPASFKLSTLKQKAAAAMLTVALLMNAGYYVKTLRDRNYAIDTMQRTLKAEGAWQGKLAMGPWAATLFWGTGAITKPIWHPSFNNKNILARFQPAALVTEPDQKDSLQALTLDGIVLPASNDLSTTIHLWDVRIYKWPPR